MKTIPVDKKFRLRELTATDAAEIFEAIDTQRSYLGHWLPFVAMTLRPEDSRQFVDDTLRAEPYEYIFTLRDGERFAGLAGFKSTDRNSRSTEIGYWLREEYQGRGIMTRAVQVLCRFAFTELGMERIKIQCATGNNPSNRIPQRLGFHLDHTELRAEQMAGGEWTDANIYFTERSDRTTPP